MSSLSFSLERLKDVYVTSARRGFMAVSDRPMCVTSASGGSGNGTIIAVKRVYREDGRWVYDNPEHYGQWWLRSAWLEALALTGKEPWRIYRLDAADVARDLDSGVFTDDIRGFRNRCEPWQPVTVGKDGQIDGTTTIAAARVWARVDGWRVVQECDGRWRADEAHCNADRSILLCSKSHFDELPGIHDSAVEAISLVEAERPWK